VSPPNRSHVPKRSNCGWTCGGLSQISGLGDVDEKSSAVWARAGVGLTASPSEKDGAQAVLIEASGTVSDVRLAGGFVHQYPLDSR